MKKRITKADETPEFVEFWEGVWRSHARHTDGRGLARDVFFEHVRAGADPRDIIDGAKCFIRTMREKDRDFIPLSSSWLNRNSYEDLAIAERAYQERVAEAKGRAANVVPLSQSIDPERRRQLVAQARAGMRGAAV
jgi:hypothetical protein